MIVKKYRAYLSLIYFLNRHYKNCEELVLVFYAINLFIDIDDIYRKKLKNKNFKCL